MTQNITFEDWEAEQMRDPEFRAAVEELEPEYQEERRRMNQRQAERAKWVRDDMDERAAKQKVRIIGTETRNEMNARAIYDLQQEVMKQAKRIEGLWDTVIEHAGHIEQLEAAAVEQHDRIGRLEATLLDVTRCLIDGKVDVDIDANVAGTMFHSHRILGAESVQAMVEVYHRLKK